MASDVSDEDLTAFLDGEAPAALAHAIETARKTDRSLSARLDGLRFDVAGLKAQADEMMSSAPARVLPQPMPVRALGSVAGAMAALILGLALGVTLANRPNAQPGWMDYVAAYQALYVPDTLSGDFSEPSDLTRLSELLGRDLSPAQDAPDLVFKRAQQLGFRGQPLVQIAYLTETGAPVALCIIKKPGEESPITANILEGMQAASWSDGEFAYLLIGGTDRALVQRGAAHFQARF